MHQVIRTDGTRFLGLDLGQLALADGGVLHQAIDNVWVDDVLIIGKDPVMLALVVQQAAVDFPVLLTIDLYKITTLKRKNSSYAYPVAHRCSL